MPQVKIYQGGQVQLNGPTNARYQGVDRGPGVVSTALVEAGKAGQEYVKKQDEIADVSAHIEANRLDLQHMETARQIGQTVRQTLGEGAEIAADQGAQQLHEQTNAILQQASPRARLLLEPSVGARVATAVDGFGTHAFEQKKIAFESSSQAVISHTMEAAADEPDEHRATLLLAPVFTQNAQRAQFFGMGKDWEAEQNQKAVSGFLYSRTLKLAQSDPNAAIEYATGHRTELNDDDYTKIVTAFGGAAREQQAKSFVDQHPELLSGGTPAVTPVPAAPGDTPQPQEHLAASQAWAFTAKHEGGYAAHDANGAPVNFGINQSANPDVDVKHLTAAGAQQLFENRYWKPSGAAKLPPALAAVHADTFYINPEQAGKFLKQANGDPQRYMDLREAWMRSMVARNPAKFAKYDKAWSSRNADLRQFASQLGGGGTGAGPLSASTPTASLSDIEARVNAVPDLSYEQRKAIIAEAKSRIGEQRSQREQAESEAARQAIDVVVGLGDNKFTSTTQIPANLWTSISPEMRLTLQGRAEANVKRNQEEARGDHGKVLDPSVAALINYTRLADPQKFISPAFQQQLVTLGAPDSAIRQVAGEAGTLAGTLAAQKPDPLSSEQIWTIAKPAFEAAGLHLDTIENGRKGSEAERAADAADKAQALKSLRDSAVAWANANPGKHPDEATVRRWVGFALIQNGPHRRYQMGGKELMETITPQLKEQIVARFRQRTGRNPTYGEAAQLYRSYVGLRAR